MHRKFIHWWAVVAGVILALCEPALAHTKWFSKDVGYADKPLAVAAVLTPTFLGLTALSLLVVALLPLADDLLQRVPAYERLREALASRRQLAPNILRGAAAIALLLSWQAGVLLAPELSYTSSFVEWFQVLIIVCLFIRSTTPVAGAGLVVLFCIGIKDYGLLHMLDYAVFVGVGFYLVFQFLPVEKATLLVKPVLFATTGFSLAWLSMEKLFFPHWSLVLLRDTPALTMGLPAEFFLVASAMVEFSLGYLLMMGVLGRPLALVITAVFFSTTTVFGKLEVIGHSMLHGVLLVFMLEGTHGHFAPPFRFASRAWMRALVTASLFAVTLATMAYAYQQAATARHVPAVGSVVDMRALHEVESSLVPGVKMNVVQAADGGWDLTFTLRNLEFPSVPIPSVHKAGQGHVHLILDGVPIGMVFESSHHLQALPPGEHCIAAELSTNAHKIYSVDGRPLGSEVTIVQPVRQADVTEKSDLR